MELFQLRIFSLAAKSKNFSKVATELFISPPSVTKYISSLEKEIGHSLFTKNGHHLVLTEFGSVFSIYVDEILAKEDEANRFLLSQKNTMIYNVAISNHMANAPLSFFNDLVITKKTFESAHKNSNVVFRFLDYYDMRSALQIGDTDIAILSIINSEVPSTLPPTLNYKKLNHFSYSLIVPTNISNHEPLEKVIPNIRALAFVNTPSPRSIAKRFTAMNGINPRLITVSNMGLALIKAVSGECATFISHNMLESARMSDVDIYQLDDEIYSNGLYALWNNKSKNLINELVEYLKEYATAPDA